MLELRDPVDRLGWDLFSLGGPTCSLRSTCNSRAGDRLGVLACDEDISVSASELSQRSALLQQSCTEGLRSRVTIACDVGNGVCASEGLRSRDAIACDVDNGVFASEGLLSRDEDKRVRASEGLRSCDAIACDVDNGVLGFEGLLSRDVDNSVRETGWDA